MKTSIYLSGETLAHLDARTAGEESSRSALLARIVDRYASVCESEKPDLAEAEWSLVNDALNGYGLLADNPQAISWCVHQVEDAIRLSGLDKKWIVDGKALLKKLSATTYAQRLAIVDAAERFWATERRFDAHRAAYDPAMESAGAFVERDEAEARRKVAGSGCICIHAPEQHRPDGCELYTCTCEWNGERSP